MIKIFYTPNMIADVNSFSPSAAKPGPVVASWLELGPPIEIVEPEPATFFQLSAAHDPDYVRGVLDCRIYNGFRNRSPEVARSLPYTSGAMVEAARAALEVGVAVAPVSGFHHACYASNGGYCTFNGLIVAALDLINTGKAKKVGILDCDHLYGNGTGNILGNLDLHSKVKHYSAATLHYRPEHAEAFLNQLRGQVFSFYGCDLIIYQAGADPHEDDPLGGWLSTEQLRDRDRIVFEACREFGIPVAWNLAGGYQEPLRRVLDIHDNTIRECATVYLEKSR